MTIHRPVKFCAALIAGGKSSRMGRDKRLIEIGGVPLWRRQLDLLRSLEPDELMISGPLDGPWAEEGSVSVVADCVGNAGPISGLISVLRAARFPLVLVLAVDMPLMSAPCLRRLLDNCGDERGVVPRRAEGFEPLAAVYPRSAVALAEELLQSGQPGLQKFAEKCVVGGLICEMEIDPANAGQFANLNSESDLKVIEAGVRHGTPSAIIH